MIARLDTLSLLRQHHSEYLEEQDYTAKTIDFVRQNELFWQRSNRQGHLTGSAWVLSHDGLSVLLLHHAKLNRWLQPGGHVDATDASLMATAQREAMEESGLEGLMLLSTSIFDLDIHQIPERGEEPAHLHYDFRFLFQAPVAAEIKRNLLETKAVEWVLLEKMATETTPWSLRRMALKAMKIKRDSERF